MTEANVAKQIGAELIKNSGRGTRKGDMTYRSSSGVKLLIDVKEHKSLTINDKMWIKVCSDAATWGSEYIPVVLGVLANGAMVACLPWSDLEDVMEGWAQND